VERVFTLEEARSLVPVLSDTLARLKAAHLALTSLAPAEGRRISAGNGSASAASALSVVEQRYTDVLREVEGLGVVLRDPQTGLVDFAATRDGDPIYFCWRLGESDIGHWHSRDTGMAGRQPL
jgi:hypothetical protein